MPNRILRDGILTSVPVSQLSWAAEVFYRRLMSVADDHGRFHAMPKLLRAACYPLQIDKVSDADIGKWITECVTAGLVSVYSASDEKRYLEIVKFGQQVRSKSKFPDPLVAHDSNCNQLTADAHLDVSVFGDVCEGVKTPLPPLPPVVVDGVDPEAWDKWMAYRKQIRKPLKPASIPAAQKALAAFGTDQSAVVEQSIANGWTGLFELKTGGQHGKSKAHQRVDNSAVARVERAYAEQLRQIDEPRVIEAERVR